MNNRHKQVHPTQSQPQSRIGDALGSTLHEHYAGLALQGLAAAYFNTGNGPKETAELAVSLADALLKELSK